MNGRKLAKTQNRKVERADLSDGYFTLRPTSRGGSVLFSLSKSPFQCLLCLDMSGISLEATAEARKRGRSIARRQIDQPSAVLDLRQRNAAIGCTIEIGQGIRVAAFLQVNCRSTEKTRGEARVESQSPVEGRESQFQFSRLQVCLSQVVNAPGSAGRDGCTCREFGDRLDWTA
jgi:hypothetical protein